MEHQIAAIGFSIVAISLIYFEKRRINKIITPFVVATLPFVVIVLITNLLLIKWDFPPVTIRAQYFIFIQLLILWLIGFYISKFFNLETITKSKTFQPISSEFKNYYLLFIIVSWIVIILVINKAINLMAVNGGWSYFAHPEYEEKMIKGFVSHMVQVGRVCFIFLVFIYRKARNKKLIIVTLMGLFIAISAIQIKYHILWLILMGFFFYLLEKSPKKQLLTLGIAASILLFVLNLFGFLIITALGKYGLTGETLSIYMARKTANYFFTGPILLDNWLNYSNIRPDWTLFIVFKNFINVIIGNPVRFDHVQLVNLGFEKVTPYIYSNVGTAYGVFYLIGGWPLTLSITIVTSLMFYTVYFYSYIKYRFELVFFNLVFLTICTLTFFVQYYTMLSTYEMPIIFLLVGYILKLINYTKEKLLT